MNSDPSSIVYARAWNERTRRERPSIVLVHGLGMSGRYMVRLAERLARERAVFAPDLPGFGRSAKPPRHLSIPEQADALRRWLRANDIGKAVLLGHSYGCQVVAQLAAGEGEASDVAGLVLVAPTVDARGRSAMGEIARLLVDAPREPVSLVALAARAYVRAGPLRVLRTLRDAIDDRIEDKLPLVAAPVLLVRGARDPIVSDRWLRELASRASASAAATIPGAAHAVNYSRPEALARLVDVFLDGLNERMRPAPG